MRRCTPGLAEQLCSHLPLLCSVLCLFMDSITVHSSVSSSLTKVELARSRPADPFPPFILQP